MNDQENSQLEWEETGLPSRIEGEKEAALLRFFHTNPQAALGFSGGVDSAYLLYAAMTAGARVKAYYVKSPFQPQFELEDARRLAEALGADWEVLETDPLSDPQVAGNPPNRCYVCKKIIFGRIAEAAQRDGFSLLLDGTNASDDDGDRPGVWALRELAVRSPLRECGLTKGEIRRLSQRAGLFTWDKPAYACLATRGPHWDGSDPGASGADGTGGVRLGRSGLPGFPGAVFGGPGEAPGDGRADGLGAGEAAGNIRGFAAGLYRGPSGPGGTRCKTIRQKPF